jgi:hypothetical protein
MSDGSQRTMVLIQLLLPTGGAHAPDNFRIAHDQARAELAEQFTGLTAYVRSPAKGLWTSARGRTEEDDVVMVEVVTNTLDRDWWRAYTVTLRKRFGQEAIHVRAIAIEMLDADAT